MRLVRTDERGLTLVELLLAVVTLAVALGALFTASSAMARTWAVGQHRVGVQQAGRASLDWMIRRIRLAGQGYERQWASCLPFYKEAGPDRFAFLADILPGGVCGPFERLEYSREGDQIVERLTGSEQPVRRALTPAEEVGTVTVTELNFCYYDNFDQLIPDQTLTGSRGQETCSGNVRPDRLADIFRVKVRVRVWSPRLQEELVVASQATRRLEVLP
ncbi:MAG: prepilin-type N-terminal cleavage/methylation domain-containing protein [Armatimonadota bacterium]|nr:prepilin-type N-terminal cleavage/methylation domain-containing protein [Armatimonadota bacterium]MDR7440195.1 prepilin-type N-terminal cleavage/methylation domain-containing protein [Armatimonadota bacterium]MDR7562592.1 prepilin-type N-terminal cleavage/methylation domain-containing protein [Armatimonadota bacterium]MDR7567835.1 prepilin-type N-terminal cleavage/methylation domain-containing protein [Armatimonadota bacterium]MDR7602875.1 prepilin-type N-terminal cleavage/methylation domain